MKNLSLALGTILVCFLGGCSSTQETTSGPTPPTTVTVAPEQKPTAEKPPEPAKPEPEEPEPAPEEPRAGGRLAFQQCTEESRKVKGCTKEMAPVCGEVDNGIRCVRAPCPSTTPQTFSNACMACVNAKTRGYWPMSCEDMNKPTAP